MPASVGHQRIMHRGEHLFHAGEPTDSVYVVRSGALKSYTIHEDGEEQVLGFHMTGDIVGFDGILASTTTCTVVALDTSCVYRLPTRLPRADADTATHTVVSAMYGEIRRLYHLLHLERASTRERLASFLLEHASKQAQRGYSERELVLPMSRRDLASYLGLATETLCRAFTHLRRQGAIEVDRNRIRIVDRETLATAAGVDAPPDARERATA